MLLPDFKAKESKESWYDIHEDWGLIEASFLKQYGLRIRSIKDMPWSEFSSLLSGLMSDTPLGNVVSIRAERDPKTLKGFSSDQRRLHREWRNRSAEKQKDDMEQYNRDMDNISKMLGNMFPPPKK